jgi:hypothetical protein
LEVIQAGHFTFMFPLEFIPKYGAFDGGIEGASGTTMPAPFTMNINLRSTSPLTSLFISHNEIGITKNKENTDVNLTIAASKRYDLVYAQESIIYRCP